MTSIAARLRVRKGRRLRVFRRLRRRQTARRQHLLDRRDDASQETRVAKGVSTTVTHCLLRVRGLTSRYTKGDRHHRLELEKVRHVVHERERLACVEEADRRRVAGGEDGGLGDAVEAGGGGRQATVHRVRPVPVRRIVAPARPAHAVAAGQSVVQLAHPHALDSPKLVDAPTLGWTLPEAKLEHLPHHLESGLFVERQARLVEQPVRASSARLARRIEPHPRLARPHQERADASGQSNGGVRDPDARLKHQAGDAAERYLDADSLLVDEHEGSVPHVELALLQEQDRAALA
jgi:hypothetical protein